MAVPDCWEINNKLQIKKALFFKTLHLKRSSTVLRY